MLSGIDEYVPAPPAIPDGYVLTTDKNAEMLGWEWTYAQEIGPLAAWYITRDYAGRSGRSSSIEHWCIARQKKPEPTVNILVNVSLARVWSEKNIPVLSDLFKDALVVREYELNGPQPI